MKSKILPITLLFLLLLLSACRKPAGTTVNSRETIMVSIEPQRFFLEKIVGDKYEICTLIPPGSNPETYDPTPAIIQQISACKLYFKVGKLGFENTTLQRLQRNSPNLIIADTSRDLDSIVAIQQGDSVPEQFGDHSSGDPHIWTSPNTALIMAKNMLDTMLEYDSENSKFYRDNFNQLKQLFSTTDSLIASSVSDAPSCSFIIHHPSLSHFARQYGLQQISIEENGKEPTPSFVKRLIDTARKDGVKVLFVDAGYNRANVMNIANEIGARVVAINLLSYYWQDEMLNIARELSQQPPL